MTRNKHLLKRGFSLLEVIVALAMLAVIAVPAVGLATMAVGRSKAQLSIGSASELKSRVDVALRAYGGANIFTAGFIPSDSDLIFVASEDLKYIELEGGTLHANNDQFYKVWVKKPKGYTYAANAPYRLLLYEVTWPNNSAVTERKQLFFTSVFRQ